MSAKFGYCRQVAAMCHGQWYARLLDTKQRDHKKKDE